MLAAFTLGGPELIAIGCVCVAPVLAIVLVLVLVWLSQRSRANLRDDAITICPGCRREVSSDAERCPHCGMPL